MKIIAWNVNGLRSIIKKGLNNFLKEENPDIFCMGETKLSCPDETIQQQMLSEVDNFPYRYYSSCSTRKGYSGTAIYSKLKPLEVDYGIPGTSTDREGRVITLHFKKVFLVHVYTPNSGQTLQRLKYRVETWDPTFWTYISELKKKKHVIVCGDLNCALTEIELFSPKTNLKSAGYTIEERESLTKYLTDLDLVDTFRYLYPEKKEVYTYWSYMRKSREKNHGWRIDYFVVSDKLKKYVKESTVISEQYGSDHAPIVIHLNYKLV